MPTIDQLASASQALATTDELPVSQLVGPSRITSKTTLGSVLALLTSLGIQPPGIAVGAGAPVAGTEQDGWSYINSANGDLWTRSAGVWVKVGSLVGPTGATGPAGSTFSLHALPTASAMAATDSVGVVVSGVDSTITLQNLLNPETIDQLTAAGSASDTDTFMVGQGSNVLVRQTLSAVWAWLQTNLPGYRPPTIQISVNTAIDATFNGKILVVTASSVTLTPNLGLMGDGFRCEIITTAGGSVVWGSGVVATNGGTGLPGSSYAKLIGLTETGVSLVLAATGSAASSGTVSAPGAITGLTAAAETQSTITYTWTAPATGGAATYYVVQYRLNGGSSWTTVPSNPTSATVTLTGLATSTAYDVEVAAANSGGTSSYVQLLNTSTAAAATYAPNAPTGLSIGSATTSALTATWTASAVDGTHSAATSYTVAVDGGAAVNVGNVTTYTATGLSSGASHSFAVVAVNSAGSSGAVTASGTTSASGGTGPFNSSGYLITVGVSGGTPTGTIARSNGTVPVNVNDNSVVTGSYTVPHSVSFAWGANNTSYPTTGLQAASGSVTTIPGANGENLWYLYMQPPASPGTYYLWALAYNTGGTLVAAFVEANAVTFT